jgi:hypothetical protein
VFEKIIQELRELEATKSISVPIHADKDGYLDKECPDERCQFQFKVFEKDWDSFQVHQVFCPMCRYEAKKDSWWTTEQINDAREKAIAHIKGRINNAFHADATNFNARQPRNSFLKMSMKFTGSRSSGYILPLASKEEMELKIQCKECNTRYAVIGSAFFCPSCGHNSAEETFKNSTKKIEVKINNLHAIKNTLIAVSKDDAEITCRSLIETGLNDCIVAFQRFCEVSFLKKNSGIKPRFNAFQNLEASGEYWQKLLGETYSDWIQKTELDKLIILFQKRHLLSHTEGIVDQRYIDNSGDNSYKIGQRVVVKEEDVKCCLALIQKIINTLKSKI